MLEFRILSTEIPISMFGISARLNDICMGWEYD